MSLILSHKDRHIVFVSGIHGVGKTTLAKALAMASDYVSVSASELILKVKKTPVANAKRVDDIDSNQQHLLDGIDFFLGDGRYIIDGHFCLLDKNNAVAEIDLRVFSAMRPRAVVVVYDEIDDIADRLHGRDNLKIDKAVLEELQRRELIHGMFVATTLKVPFLTLQQTDPDRAVPEFLISLLKSV